MLADSRAVGALAGNFAGQWLNLRRVGEVVVDPEVYPNFDTNLLEAFQTETSLFVGSEHPGGPARCPNCSTPTTRSSTSVWPVTTAFPASTAAASAG